MSRRRFLPIMALYFLSSVVSGEHLYESFALPGFEEINLGTVSLHYEIRDSTPDGGVFVGAKVYRNLNGKTAHVPFWFNDEAGLQLIPLPAGVEPPSGFTTVGIGSGVSEDGQFIVGRIMNPSGQLEAFRYEVANDRLELLGHLKGANPAEGDSTLSRATGVSANGSVITGQSLGPDGYPEAFVWTKAEGMVRVFTEGHPDFESSWAYAVSADGTRLGGFLESGYTSIGFFRNPEGEITQLPLLEGGSFNPLEAFAGSSSAMLGKANRPGPGPSGAEQVGFIWEVESPMKFIPAPGPIYRFDPGSVTEALDFGAGTAISSPGEADWDNAWWRAAVWYEETGTDWLDTVLSDRYHFEWKGARFLLSAFVCDDGSHILAAGGSGAVYRIPLSLTVAAAYTVFPSSRYRGGTRSSQWLGELRVERFPWVEHDGMGWVYIEPLSRENKAVWIWKPGRNAWLVTSDALYPALYCYRDRGWLRHLQETEWVFNYTTDSWESL